MDPNLRAHLIADPAVLALVGQRIYRQRMPQQDAASPKAFPAVVFQRVGGSELRQMCGTSELRTASMQVDVYGTRSDDVAAVADAIRARMGDYSGVMGSVTVQRVLLDTEFDAPPEAEPGLYRRTFTFSIWYLEV